MTILFSGGGTLGPVTPLLAVAEAIAAHGSGARLVWVGTADGPEHALVEGAGIRFIAIPSGKFRRYFSLRNVSDLFRIAAGFVRAFAVLRSERPSVVVTAGGYVAVPLVWAAALRRVPVHVHAQDIRPGLANRLCAPFAHSVSVAFERSLADFSAVYPVWTGNPVRRAVLEGSRERAVTRFGLEPDVPTLLAVGGGSGAAGLNALVRDAARMLSGELQVLHVTGKGKGRGPVAEIPRYHELEFLTDAMGDALAVADIVVARAGIGTLSELAALGKPTVLVPLPGSHQEDNAAFAAGRAAVVVANEPALDADAFATIILDLWRDADRRAGLVHTIHTLTKQDAAGEVAALVLAAAGSRHGAA